MSLTKKHLGKLMAIVVVAILIVSSIQLIVAKDTKANLIELSYNMNGHGDKSALSRNRSLQTNINKLSNSNNDSVKTVSSTNNDDDLFIGFLAGYSHSKIVLGALPLAIEAVNNRSDLLPGKQLKFKTVDIGTQIVDNPKSISLMTQLKEEGVLAFIGPDETCKNEAFVAAAWNIPMISFGCTETMLSEKKIYHSFARTYSPASKMSKSVIALLKAFDWNKFVLIVGTRYWSSEVGHAIKELAETIDYEIIDVFEYSDYIPTHIYKMEKIISDSYQDTRIYVFVGEHIAMVDFVRCLQNRKLLETGDYAVISVDDEIYNPKKRSLVMEREYLDPYLKRNLKSKAINVESIRSVLKLTPSHPSNTGYGEFCENIKLLSRNEPFSIPYHEVIFRNLPVPINAAHLYDAVLIYAKALTEVLEGGGDIRNGTQIMSHIFNRTYNSIQGFDVYIDSKGDAEGNYTVVALQEDLLYNNTPRLSMQKIGFFVYSSLGEIPEFKYLDPQRKIRFLKGRIPLAEPKCGFHGEKCKPKARDWRYLVSGIFMLLFLAVAGAFSIKHYRYEQTLACLLWKIDMKDVTLITATEYFNNPTANNKNVVQICRHSLNNNPDISKRAYTTIGLYRGNIVALKRIYKKSVDVTRNIRKELKQMREVRHENVVGFIGASIEHGNIIILTAYCARGSLEDVLANEDLYLDQMFISSLVSDIIKGMIYLHESDIMSHGNLRSSNCLVDSRWVCQITDFGLNEFKYGQEEPNKLEMETRRNLWRAPELLRQVNPPARGTQKGDVYSFGIVLYEIVGRNGPWGETSMALEDIVSNVKSTEIINGTPYRPPLRQLDVPDYVRQCLKACWEEDPESRPDIRLVRVKLKQMQAGLKPNIFDNMLAIMEKYAYNLEGLVQERTLQLSEEKKKTEALLLRMLPKSVAESLKHRERVEAECFDYVTIYFSDLVGFTELCAKSTPFEVVEMLNDLYTCCDSIISGYDVYKIETIGDAYMVVSGLPIRNGDKHAGEIASLSLHLLHCVSKLEIRHRPGELLQIRIGINTGPCVAGVVGLKMPRYCLFGDTVNTASRMESTGEAMKIHISSSTYNLLKKIGGYKCEERGITYVKGKGEMQTYWLLSEDDDNRLKRSRKTNSYELPNLSPSNVVAPDLICDAENESNSHRSLLYTGIPRPRSFQISNRGRVSCSTFHSNSDQLLPSLKTSNNNITSEYCFECHKHKFSQTQQRKNNDEICDIYRISSSATVDTNFCNCIMRKCAPERDGNVIIGTNRVPRSAPHITFMQ